MAWSLLEGWPAHTAQHDQPMLSPTLTSSCEAEFASSLATCRGLDLRQLLWQHSTQPTGFNFLLLLKTRRQVIFSTCSSPSFVPRTLAQFALCTVPWRAQARRIQEQTAAIEVVKGHLHDVGTDLKIHRGRLNPLEVRKELEVGATEMPLVSPFPRKFVTSHCIYWQDLTSKPSPAHCSGENCVRGGAMLERLPQSGDNVFPAPAVCRSIAESCSSHLYVTSSKHKVTHPMRCRDQDCDFPESHSDQFCTVRPHPSHAQLRLSQRSEPPSAQPESAQDHSTCAAVAAASHFTVASFPAQSQRCPPDQPRPPAVAPLHLPRLPSISL
eukprot:3786058-Rhodomonas_salina.4